MKLQRIQGLDIFRGLAILLMVGYHFTYDLNHFNIININMNHDLTFLIIRYVIMSMFLLSVGISLALSHLHSVNYLAIRKRMLYLGLASSAVTLATYIVFPNSWVYFGILHFILLSSILALPLIKFPKITLFLTLFICIGSSTELLHMHSLFTFLQPLIGLPTPHSEDLVPLFPWLSMVLIGIIIVQHNWQHKIFNHRIFNANSLMHKTLKKLGKNSLLIYLIHQPILFVSFDLYFKFFSK